MIKVLNLYACIGGNRFKWDEVAPIQVTAVEKDPDLARLYKERFPNDKVLITDAHLYLLNYYQDFDFIWSSPPCPTHSRARFWNSSNENTATKPAYPDMRLYEEIIFLTHHFKGKWCVENVVPYYEPMFAPKKRGRHLFWSNFRLPNVLSDREFDFDKNKSNIEALSEFHQFNFKEYRGGQRKDKIARNCVDYVAGRTIFETALEIQRANNSNQIKLF